MSTVTSRLEAPQPTKNSLRDTIDWLKLGDSVVLHVDGKSGLVYHKCVKGGDKQEANKVLKGIRVIHLNAQRMPSLLAKGEWPSFIEHAGITPCDCVLKDRVLSREGIPHFYSFTL